MKWIQWLAMSLWLANAAVAAEGSSIGFQGSVNMALSNASDLVSQSFQSGGVELGSRTGFMVGIRSETPVSQYVSLQTEVMYTQKGFGLTYGALSGTAEMDFISTALLAKVKFTGPESTVRPYVYLGPEFGVNVGSQTAIGSGQEVAYVSFPYRFFDLDLDMGFGVEATVAQGVSLFTDLRYSRGLTNLIANAKAGASITTSMFQAIAGVKFSM